MRLFHLRFCLSLFIISSLAGCATLPPPPDVPHSWFESLKSHRFQFVDAKPLEEPRIWSTANGYMHHVGFIEENGIELMVLYGYEDIYARKHGDPLGQAKPIKKIPLKFPEPGKFQFTTDFDRVRESTVTVNAKFMRPASGATPALEGQAFYDITEYLTPEMRDQVVFENMWGRPSRKYTREAPFRLQVYNPKAPVKYNINIERTVIETKIKEIEVREEQPTPESQ